MKKIISFAFSMIFIVAMTFAQSKTVSEFSDNTKGYTAFLYQSVIRVMNKDQNPDFNKLIRDLDHIKLALSEHRGIDAKQVFKTIDTGVKGEGFEMIMSFNNKDYKCNAYELESRNGKSTWVTTFMTEGYAGAMEMKGTLDLKYIEALSSLNYEQIKSMIPSSYIKQHDKIKETKEKIKAEEESKEEKH